MGGKVSGARRTCGDGVFAPGTLLERVRGTSAAALRTRALEPIHTRSSYLEDHGIQFLVRVVSNLRRKPPNHEGHNPFLPFEPALYVADASDTHVCILNKYNVVELHLLIVTRQFAHQESPIDPRDFHALWRCLNEYDSLGFYNSGAMSGASQSHKHLQVVPLPLSSSGAGHATPTEPLLEKAGARPGTIAESAEMPFAHSLVFWEPQRVSDTEYMARTSCDFYRQMLERHDLTPRRSDGHVAGCYNLLVTRRWMLLVPRAHECFQSISFNSLAFAGALLVQDPEQMDQLRTAGPFAALQWVAAGRP
jgi:sulfate adenylyltransferase (ADP) / ATP adenylyltransferase